MSLVDFRMTIDKGVKLWWRWWRWRWRWPIL